MAADLIVLKLTLLEGGHGPGALGPQGHGDARDGHGPELGVGLVEVGHVAQDGHLRPLLYPAVLQDSVAHLGLGALAEGRKH